MALCHGRSCQQLLMRTALSIRLVPGRFASLVAGQPDRPIVKTAIPGPRTEELKAHLSSIQTAGNVNVFTDYERSIGNYLCDADGNMILDLFSQISSAPLGYNHPAIIEAIKDPRNMVTLVNRPSLGMFPPTNLANQLQETLLRAAPQGLRAVQTMGCGSCSNEFAYKTACIHYMSRQRGRAPSALDLSSCLKNEAPGTPNLVMLSFEGCFHGRTAGSLSCTYAKPIHKLDQPTMPWPHAPFPKLKYPLAEHEEANMAEEMRCLDEVERIIEDQEEAGKIVAGIVVEPVQGEGGDNWASPSFFRQLQYICKKRNITFIVDEVQSGLAITGSMWAHDHWGLEEAPDIVIFAKKMMAAGFYLKESLIVHEGGRIFNTWMGDPNKLIILGAVLDVVERDNLIEKVAARGEEITTGLLELQKAHPEKIFNVRGQGTHLAFDATDTSSRDDILNRLKQKGVMAGGCGSASVRLRPTLILESEHVAIFLDSLGEVLSEMA